MPLVDGKPRRPNSRRLAGLDYRSQGAYFVTFTVRRTGTLLARITPERHESTHLGQIVEDEMARLAVRYPGVRIEEPMIMPDHVHMIVWLESPDVASLSTVVGGLKTASARRINKLLGQSGRFWQSSFHDRYIRNEREFDEIAHYIRMNPERWRIKYGLI